MLLFTLFLNLYFFMIAFLDRIVMWVYYFHQKRSFPEQIDQGFFQLHVKEKSTS